MIRVSNTHFRKLKDDNTHCRSYWSNLINESPAIGINIKTNKDGCVNGNKRRDLPLED